MQSTMPLVALGCEIRYADGWNGGHAGMDRGRVLAAMDAELVAALGQAPQNAAEERRLRMAAGDRWWRWTRRCSGAMWCSKRRW